MVTRIYLDACTLNRLLDDQKQLRIRREAEAVEEVFRLIQSKRAHWIAGDVLEAEIARTPDSKRRDNALALLRFADESPRLSARVASRGALLERAGYGAFDALHLAVAEEFGADALLTTDDQFLKQAKRGLGKPATVVVNPLNWVQARKP